MIELLLMRRMAFRALKCVLTATAAIWFAASPLRADIEGAKAQVGALIERLARECKSDLENFCSAVTPGEGRLAMCLYAHAHTRSAQCDDGLRSARREIEDFIVKSADACEGDISKFCGTIEPGDGRIASCIMEQRENFTEGCGSIVDVLAQVIFPEGNVPEQSQQAATSLQIDSDPAEPQATPDASANTSNNDIGPSGAKATVMAAITAKVAGFIESGKAGCSEDLEKYCSKVVPGEGRLVLCLVAHADKRSSSCEKALTAIRTEAEKLIEEVNSSIEACSPDVAALCAGTEPGEGRIAQCLVEQRDALTEDCAQVIDTLSRVVFAPSDGATTTAAQTPATGTVPEVSPAGLGEADTPAADEKKCRSFEASVTDWGQKATQEDARRAVRAKMAAFASKRGLEKHTSGVGRVTCSAQIDLGFEGYYTCRARAEVCWTSAANARDDSKVKR